MSINSGSSMYGVLLSAETPKNGLQYGSTDPPTDKDIKLTDDLVQLLTDKFHLTEMIERTKQREQALNLLKQLTNKWVEDDLNQKELPTSKTILMTFGSFKLGVHHAETDMDTLCIGPSSINNIDFFKHFYEILKRQPEVTDLAQIPDASVPIIKMRICSVPVDLQYLSINIEVIPEEFDILNEDNLRTLTEQDLRSLNGCRVTDQILQLVPNVEHFRIALKTIKHWASVRGIYSNNLGFFPGISYTLLVARVCQLWPNAAPATLVSNFFHMYHTWRWPSPITVTPNFKINFLDKTNLMPVVTPGSVIYTSQNTSYNISESTMKVIKFELKRAVDVMGRIEREPGHPDSGRWDLLFEKSDFFERYKIYVQVEILGSNNDEFTAWKSWIESKIRMLVKRLENTKYLKYACPFPYIFETQNLTWQKSCSIFLGLEFNVSRNCPDKQNVNLRPAVSDFYDYVKDWNRRKDGHEVSVRWLKRANLPDVVLKPK